MSAPDKRIPDKKESRQQGEDGQDDEGQEEDDADEEHRAGHPRIGSEDDRNGPEEQESAPSPGRRCALRRNWQGVSVPRLRVEAGRPQQERQQENREDQENAPESKGGGPDDDPGDENQVHVCLPPC